MAVFLSLTLTYLHGPLWTKSEFLLRVIHLLYLSTSLKFQVPYFCLHADGNLVFDNGDIAYDTDIIVGKKKL
jgi:predicted transcriptional regulator